MRNVKPSRIALALSLVVLGGSLATLVSATDAASAITADTAHEFAVEDGALVTTVDGRTKTLVPDVGTVERITVTTVDGRLVVRTEPLAPPDVSVAQRARAKRIVTDEPAIANTIDAAGGAVYTIRPVPDGVSSDQAAVIGADAERPWNRLVPATDAAFVAHDTADANALVVLFAIPSSLFSHGVWPESLVSNVDSGGDVAIIERIVVTNRSQDMVTCRFERVHQRIADFRDRQHSIIRSEVIDGELCLFGSKRSGLLVA
jgi:hypothetical protein